MKYCKWVILLFIFLILSCCVFDASTPKVSFKIYLVSYSNINGEKIGCGDTLISLPITTPKKGSIIETAIRSLLTYQDKSDFKNIVLKSDLTLRTVEIKNTHANVNFDGQLSLSGACDIPRVLAQLEK
ncbi:hypothetical protein KO527_21805 [Pseudoalteromonas sp. C2R02]|uniref:hypothetical protein n=1 Tax=Pseudoalteromonas sp. C2R02 TaxID=2841565 RepID=UPI001C099760|nr:hypothetical protein [Pseudoalteromonas sp. C2R02]MBU2971977.1 hypothetical protein [Pseudoalteromonas sp. C2R02]